MKKISLIPIMIIMMTFGMITKVKANTCTGLYNSAYTPLLNQTATLTKGMNAIDITLDNSVTWNSNSQYDTLESKMWYVIENTDNTITSNIEITDWNLSLTCQREDIITTGGSQWGYIAYQDGTTATIQSTLKGVVCEYYQGQITTQNNTTTIQTNWKYEPNITSVGFALMSGATPIFCKVDSNGNFSCPKQAYNITFNKVRFYFALEKSATANIKFGVVTRNWNWCTSDTQQVINNNNQNSQSIINNQNQNYNNFNNQDINSQSKTPLDTTASDSVNQKETQIYDIIKQSPSELDILSIDLDPDTNNWIWTTINTLIGQHRYLTILFVSVMTLGVAKLIFGR